MVPKIGNIVRNTIPIVLRFLFTDTEVFKDII